MRKTVLALVFFASMAASADGLRIEGGRYAGGAATTLVVSEAQLAGWPEQRWVALTEDQRLKEDTGIAPSEVFVYDARIGETDCTCHAWNVAFLFSPEGLDVPHRFVVSDEEAARRQAELDSIE